MWLMFRFGTMQVLELPAQSKISFISSVRRSNSHPEIKSNQHIFWPHGNINEATWHMELHGQRLGTTRDNLENTIWNNNKCQRHHIHQTERQVNQLKRTKYTNQKPNAPTLFCLEAVQWWRTKDDKYEVDASKNYLNFPGRERCLQNGCWKDTSTRFNITQSYLVGKFNRNILRDEIYFQVTCCHFSGDSRHAVGLIFDIKLNLKWIQWLRLLETQILYKDVRVVVTWKKSVTS